jgi:predicted nucleic acid-binding protein
MIVLVDTSVWSLALRRKKLNLSADQLGQLQKLEEILSADQVRLLGVVRQELLSGIKSRDEFLRMREQLRSMPDVALEIEDYEQAAELGNACRARGIAVGPIDMLLCAVALRRNWSIFTCDRDFERYTRHLPIVLFS